MYQAPNISCGDLQLEEKIEFEEVRGQQGIKRATIKIGEKEVKAVIASGLGNAQTIMEEIKSGKADYQFVEIMACPTIETKPDLNVSI